MTCTTASPASVTGGGLGLPVIGRLLGHASPAMTAKYSHLADDPMRRAADLIGNTISAAMNRKPSAEVVPISKRAGTVG